MGLSCLVIAGSLLVIAISCSTIYTASLDILLRDEWDFQATLARYSLLDAVLRKQGQHATPLPMAVYLVNNAVFGGRSGPIIVSIMGISWLIAALFAYGLTRSEGLLRRRPDPVMLAAALTAATLSFWFVSRYNRFWGGGIFSYLCLLGVILCALGTSKLAARGYRLGSLDGLMTLVGALVATFSFGAGLAVWPMLVVLLALTRAPSRAWWVAGGLAACCIVSVSFLPGDAAPIPSWRELVDIAPLAAHVARFVGAAASFAVPGRADPGIALGAGVLGLMALSAVSALAYTTRHHPRIFHPSYLFYLGLMWFVVAVGGLVALSRSDLGIANSMANRYGIWTALFWQAAILLGLAQLLGARTPRVHRLVSVTFMAFVVSVVAYTNVRKTPRQIAFQSELTSQTIAAVIAPDAILAPLVGQGIGSTLRIGPPRLLLKMLPVVRAQRLNVFAWSWPHRLDQPFPGDLRVDPDSAIRGGFSFHESMADGVFELGGFINYEDDSAGVESLIFVEQGRVVGAAVPVADPRPWQAEYDGALRAWWSTGLAAFRRNTHFVGAAVTSGPPEDLRIFGLIRGADPARVQEIMKRRIVQ